MFYNIKEFIKSKILTIFLILFFSIIFVGGFYCYYYFKDLNNTKLESKEFSDLILKTSISNDLFDYEKTNHFNGKNSFKNKKDNFELEFTFLSNYACKNILNNNLERLKEIVVNNKEKIVIDNETNYIVKEKIKKNCLNDNNIIKVIWF